MAEKPPVTDISQENEQNVRNNKIKRIGGIVGIITGIILTVVAVLDLLLGNGIIWTISEPSSESDPLNGLEEIDSAEASIPVTIGEIDEIENTENVSPLPSNDTAGQTPVTNTPDTDNHSLDTITAIPESSASNENGESYNVETPIPITSITPVEVVWSDWLDVLPNGISTTIESRTVYRYRNNTEETKVSTSKLDDSWTLLHEDATYGDWSDWSDYEIQKKIISI